MPAAPHVSTLLAKSCDKRFEQVEGALDEDTMRLETLETARAAGDQDAITRLRNQSLANARQRAQSAKPARDGPA